jgi:hypothetical protein
MLDNLINLQLKKIWNNALARFLRKVEKVSYAVFSLLQTSKTVNKNMGEWKVEEGQVDQIYVNAIQPFVRLLLTVLYIKFLVNKSSFNLNHFKFK